MNHSVLRGEHLRQYPGSGLIAKLLRASEKTIRRWSEDDYFGTVDRVRGSKKRYYTPENIVNYINKKLRAEAQILPVERQQQLKDETEYLINAVRNHDKLDPSFKDDFERELAMNQPVLETQISEKKDMSSGDIQERLVQERNTPQTVPQQSSVQSETANKTSPQQLSEQQSLARST